VCECMMGKVAELKPSCVFNGPSSENGVDSHNESGVRWCEVVWDSMMVVQGVDVCGGSN
jgi:hypothetical protein